MDRIVFHYDTVLSDIHLLLPNAHHLMARLNRVGQPVFISKFKVLWNGEAQDTCELSTNSEDNGVEVGSPHEEDEGEVAEERVQRSETDEDESVDKPVLDEDGDLQVKRRPRTILSGGRDQGETCPVILSQSSASQDPASDEEEEEDEVESNKRDIIRIGKRLKGTVPVCVFVVTLFWPVTIGPFWPVPLDKHTMATPLQDVGKQVWRGAFLLADYIYSHAAMFRGATVLELGAGTGLASIIMGTTAKLVYSTDVGEDLLSMCKRNATLNGHLLASAGGEVKVRQLDWLRDDLCTDSEAEFSWTEDEVADLHDHTSVIIAADVCYDDDLTDGFFRTVYRLCNGFSQPCTVYLSIEKRMNFSLRHMDVSCEAYDYFRHCLDQLQAMEDGRRRFHVDPLAISFRQCLQYERIEQLELWKVTSTTIPKPLPKGHETEPAST